MGKTYKDSKAFKEKVKKEKESTKLISKDKSKKHKRNYYEREDQEDFD